MRLAVLQIQDPGSRIPDPRKATKEGEKLLSYGTFFAATGYEDSIVFLNKEKTKIKNHSTFKPKKLKNVTTGLGSGKRVPEKTGLKR